MKLEVLNILEINLGQSKNKVGRESVNQNISAYLLTTTRTRNDLDRIDKNILCQYFSATCPLGCENQLRIIQKTADPIQAARAVLHPSSQYPAHPPPPFLKQKWKGATGKVLAPAQKVTDI